MVCQTNESANSMNCRESETSGKLRGLIFSIGTLVYLLSIKISPSTSKKDPLPRIKQTEYDMDSKIKLKISKEMLDELEQGIWLGDYSWKIISSKKFISFSYRI